MLIENYSENKRAVYTKNINTDVVVAGGGISGVCAAIGAARQGKKVVLIQDRPVLGGNASSEVRLWILGATSHMGNNNRWAREGGIMDEILVENMYRNKEGNALIFDTILLEKVTNEKNITLLLNTSVYEVEKEENNKIKSTIAFCSQNSTKYVVDAKYFVDGTGDGILAFLAGASFRMGAEKKEEFGELFAPDEDYGELLGHSIYFYSKDAGQPVKYVAPEFALKDITVIPRYKNINSKDYGCRFWWFEYGGRKDTILESEDIKWELWKVVYGAWDYIKNSGNFPDAENLTLEWVGTVPGKRESRRFEGLYMMKQQDVIEQADFEDAISHGGWAVDLHPADGVYSEKSGCTQWHSKGTYSLPLRSHISKDISNLFFIGRIISATHVAFGSTRVMATAGMAAHSIGVAAAKCIDENLTPAQLTEGEALKSLQHTLNLEGQGLMGIPLSKNGIMTDVDIKATSSLKLDKLPASDNIWHDLSTGTAQMLPLKKNQAYTFSVKVKSEIDTNLEVELRASKKARNYTPDLIIEKVIVPIAKGEQIIEIPFTKGTPEDQYAMLTFLKNEGVFIQGSEIRVTGLLSVFNGKNKAVSNNGKQTPPDNIGVDAFEFWIPKRRPEGHNVAFSCSPALEVYNEENSINGYVRPHLKPNAWVADLEDKNPALELSWNDTKEISAVTLFFDTDYDHAMESTLMGHPESVMPFTVRNYKIKDDKGNVVYSKEGNYQTINKIEFDQKISTTKLVVEVEHPSTTTPASIFEIMLH